MQLSGQERDFCCYFAESGDVRAAAVAAGFKAADAFLSGCGVLQNPTAARLIKRQRGLLFGKDGEDVKMALRRLIFSCGGRLVADEEAARVAELDLFGAVEVKQGKGALEVKLVNKLSAIEQLYTLETAAVAKSKAANFFEALGAAKESGVSDSPSEGGVADEL